MLSVLFVFTMGACGNLGGCGACGAASPLPAGGLPANQTIEGGAQIRVTPQGFTKLTSILPGVINSSLSAGFCVGQGSLGNFALSADYCTDAPGGACGAGHGCNISVGVHPNSLAVSVTNANLLHFAIGLDVHTVVGLDGAALGISVGSCDMHVDGSNLLIDADIALGITASNGELNITLNHVNNFDTSGLSLSNCGIISDLGNLVNDVLNSFVGQFAIQLLTPALNSLIQGFLPSPLGIEGELNIGQLLAGVSPGTVASMEARVVPGGYVSLNGAGMSLGVITGLNSDIDPSTRTGTRPDGVPYISEPALCVPPLPIPDFSAAPFNLPLVPTRNTFSLNPAGEFDGMPDPASADLAMGISKTMLDLAGHHLVTSGGMCLGVGTAFISQLNVGTIGILVPSLADLASDTGTDPLLLVTRPQREIVFTIGDNTMASPALTIGLSHMEVDFYAFLYERYVRAFTLDLTMNIGVNLAFEQPPGMPATITPTLVGISSDNVTVAVLNSDFVKETPQHLEMVLPSVFDLVTPLLGNLPAINVPSFAGFSLNNLSIQHVTTSQDDFLALYASLGAGAMARALGQHDAFAADAVRMLDATLPATAARSTGRATLRGVATPAPAIVLNALLQQPGGALPKVTFDVDHYDMSGRELEWTWNLNGGLFHQYTSDNPIVISDRAFAWQGKYTVGLKSRVKGDYHTVSEVIATPIVIDSMGPKVFVDEVRFNEQDELIVPIHDIVSGSAVTVAYGTPGADQPTTDWTPYADATLPRALVEKLVVGGELQVFTKDEIGNQTIALIAPFHGTAGAAGCTCETGGGRPGAGGFALIGIVGFGLLRRRRKINRRTLKMLGTFAVWLGASVAVSLQPGCSCGKNAGAACETVADCSPSSCPKGQLPFCVDNTCVCSDDVPPGRVGPYSDVATAPDGTIWVSAYAQSYGDLVVAQATGGRIPDDSWEWVDGVPSGPVVVPMSKIRGGITDMGVDVGMYTSIVVGPDGTPMVTYFDVDNASLKFAAKVNGAWQIHVIDAGTGNIANVGGAEVGMYTSMSLRTDDGRPGVAYLAHVNDATGVHAEVRYAAAQVPIPASAGDWQTWVVDTGMVPPDDPANPNIYPLPEGLGLFIDSERNPTTQAPVVAYYDRTMGELKVAKFNVASGEFDAPIVLDGTPGSVDAGWSPSVQVDPQGVVHVAYVDATTDDLDYVTEGMPKEIIDDGYRIVGQTVDGLPKPTFDFVGDDAGLVIPASGQPMVVYQDSTTQELLLAQRGATGMWSHASIAGATQPWPGAYGFFASAALTSTDIIMSTWVIDQPTDDNWVEVFSQPTVIE